MNILVIGSGGREHAIAWRLAKSPLVRNLYAAPGNPGIARVAECKPAASIEDYLSLATQLNIDLTVVGPEAPLVAGIVDRFRAAGLAIFGPTAAAARLEGSKSFSKDFMIRAGIPTARHKTVTNIQDARRAIQDFGYPVVLKADGLAAGKGVVIAQSADEAEKALPGLLGQRLVIEEFLQGEEVSFIVLSDGRNVLPLQPSQDHKAVNDNDQGPNTGGMGAYCDSRILTSEQTGAVMQSVIEPAVAQMAAEKTPFTGFCMRVDDDREGPEGTRIQPSSEIPKPRQSCIEWTPILCRPSKLPLTATWGEQRSNGNPNRASASYSLPTVIRAKSEPAIPSRESMPPKRRCGRISGRHAADRRWLGNFRRPGPRSNRIRARPPVGY